MKEVVANNFTNAQEVYTACGAADYDEKRVAAVLVNRISESAVEVFIAAGSTKKWQTLKGFGKLEFFAEPKKVVGKSTSGEDIFLESGQPASLAAAAGVFSENEEEILIIPKFTIPIGKEASSIRVKINGFYGAGKVTRLTANIERENIGKICYMSKYPRKK